MHTGTEGRIHRIKWLYALALGFVALTLIASSVLLQRAIDLDKSDARVINLSGRQRMLSQRMAKAYLFRQMGVNAAEAGSMLDTAMKEFAKAHEQLKAAAQSTAQIKSELALVDQQWFFFQNSLSQRAADDMKKAAASVATTSERILEEMDSVVALYEKL